MIKAMQYAQQGMRQATNQANDAAKRILESTTESFQAPQTDTPERITSDQTGPVRASIRDLVAPSSDNLIYGIVDLKIAEHNFEANANVYKRMSDMTDDFIKTFDKDNN